MSVLGGWRFSDGSRIATNTDTDGRLSFVVHGLILFLMVVQY